MLGASLAYPRSEQLDFAAIRSLLQGKKNPKEAMSDLIQYDFICSIYQHVISFD